MQRKVRNKRILSKGNDKYSKVSHKAKIVLLKKVICDGCEIKQVSVSLGLNYSTAKTLLRKFKNHGEDVNYEVLRGISDWFETYSAPKERCTYKIIESSQFDSKAIKKPRKKSLQATCELESLQKQRKKSPFENLAPTRIQIMQQVIFRE